MRCYWYNMMRFKVAADTARVISLDGFVFTDARFYGFILYKVIRVVIYDRYSGLLQTGGSLLNL